MVIHIRTVFSRLVKAVSVATITLATDYHVISIDNLSAQILLLLRTFDLVFDLVVGWLSRCVSKPRAAGSGDGGSFRLS